jgi:hypothetical protein
MVCLATVPLPVPDAVHLAKESNRAAFLRDAIDAAKSPIKDSVVWQLCVAFLRFLEDHGASGDWRVANLILWLSWGQRTRTGEYYWVGLTLDEIRIRTGHSEESAKRHLTRLIARGFIERRRRSRISLDYLHVLV